MNIRIETHGNDTLLTQTTYIPVRENIVLCSRTTREIYMNKNKMQPNGQLII